MSAGKDCKHRSCSMDLANGGHRDLMQFPACMPNDGAIDLTVQCAVPRGDMISAFDKDKSKPCPYISMNKGALNLTELELVLIL